MRISFPYVQKGAQWYPTIDITLRGKKDELTVRALLDSGASFSVFRPEIAEHIGIQVEKGKAIYLEGIGGRILGYLHRVRAVVGNKRFVCSIVFSREFTVSFSLLGRDNFFSQFRITFDEKKRMVVLE
ncbi:MAG: hypothetical protein G01um101433_496 [Parcubacteria group bacterium Gr01-1014_33]|nr:MAG: hypothetical protein G01um101433_496 [Parcubacteria group bacterium Gr01-1014_33]